jgi:hypothetical protein
MQPVTAASLLNDIWEQVILAKAPLQFATRNALATIVCSRAAHVLRRKESQRKSGVIKTSGHVTEELPDFLASSTLGYDQSRQQSRPRALPELLAMGGRSGLIHRSPGSSCFAKLEFWFTEVN